MFLTTLCTQIGVVSGDRDESGGEEFPAGSALDPEVVAGRQPGALGFRAESPDALGAGGCPAQSMGARHGVGSCGSCVGKSPGHTIARMARYALFDGEAMML